DHPKHVRGCRLLLQRLGEFLFQIGIGCAVSVSSRLRCVRTKTGNASSALRPFASQDHLVGTVTRLSILTQPRDTLATFHTRSLRLRYSRNGIYGISFSLLLDACELDHLAPLFGFLGDEPAKVCGRDDKRRASKVGKPRLDLGIGEGGVNLSVELVD